MAIPGSLAARFRRTTFGRQLTLVAAVGVVCVCLLAALITGWQGSRQIRSTQIEQGARLAQSLAAQARLALLFSAKENMEEALGDALAFPDVVDIDVWHADGNLLVHRSKVESDPGHRVAPADGVRAGLESETDEAWQFIAPVLTIVASESPFDTGEAYSRTLGYVRVTQSKATLARLMREVFAVNLAVGLVCALAFVFVLGLLARRLTRPLATLATTMEQAETGRTGLRARLEGPRDLYHMAPAFNSMMAALEEREEELRTARDSALRFARLKAEFAATVSHEIRTPLNGVIGTLDMLKSVNPAGRQRELLDLAWDSSQYLLELINNILDFSRLEAGRLEPEKTAFDLHALVAETVRLFLPQAQSKHLLLTQRIDPAVPARVIGDPARIRQVLSNLTANALKFTATGRVAVDVDVPAAGRVRFSVSDTGIGIAREDQARIFDSFSQADPSTTRRFGGSGLGLAICRQLVRVMGGEIGVESTPGQGSRFRFAIPCTASRPETAQALPATDGPAREAPRILVVEDNRTNQVVAEGMLQMLGCKCRIAPEGHAAVEAWRDAHWDMILMDCNMPEMDGYDAARAIRMFEQGCQPPRPRRTRIIALTANALAGERERCLAAGMDDYLTKPFTAQQFREVLLRNARHGLHPPAPRCPRTRPGADLADRPFNPERLEQLCADLDPETVASMVRDLLDEVPARRHELERLYEGNDWKVLERAAHSLKGLGASFGLGSLAAACLALEQAAARRDPVQVRHQLAAIPSEVEAGATALRSWLVRSRPSSRDQDLG